MFGSLGADQWPAGNKEISELMQGYWSHFARAGDPNGDPAPQWPKFSTERGNRLNIDLDPDIVEDFRADRCAVWREYYDSLFE